MNYLHNHRQHAALSLIILVLVIAVSLYGLLYPAVSLRMSYLDRLERLRFQYEKLEQAVGQTENLRQEVNELKQLQPDRSGYLENQPVALAAADLQKYFSNMVAQAGGNLISTQVIRDKEDTLFPRIAIKAHLRCDIESLQKVLYRLRAGNPVLLVDNLMIQNRNTPGPRRGQQDSDVIEVRFDISGYMYQEKPSS